MNPEQMLDGILGDDAARRRRAMAKAITLLESVRPEHRLQADELLTRLIPHTGKSFRLGISGVPGVGKSTFIEALGLWLIARGHQIAVLAVDPSSSVSGGSILGDKTRMEQLSVHPNAYIRPSPSRGSLGGVAEKTRESMLICEAAGYDVVIVETVGVGQSETAVANMTDMFCLLQLPNAGDDLQAIKKGVMELADLVIINKADADPQAAVRAEAQISGALHLLASIGSPKEPKGRWLPKVVKVSALNGKGIDEFWTSVASFQKNQTEAGLVESRRRTQALDWMWERIDAELKRSFHENPAIHALLPTIIAQVEGGVIPASAGARQLIATHEGKQPPHPAGSVAANVAYKA